MRGWLSLAAKLYPKAWRERYGAEFAGLLDDVEPQWTDVPDVLRGAVTMQLKMLSTYLKLVGALTVAGLIVAVSVSFLLPGLYMSTAVIRAGAADDPQTSDRFQHAWQEVMTRGSLAELIQRPNLDLYKSERSRKPLEDVIEQMKTKDLRIEGLKDPGNAAFRISFLYPDRFKAQAVVDALTKKVINADRARWVVGAATLPDAPGAPDRLFFMLCGLGIGLLAGVVASFLCWRPKWTMKVIGFGLAGCVIAAALSLLIPNRYTSTAVLRVIPAPKADGVQRYMPEAEMADWLRKKERVILSDESLSGIIQRPALDLYHKEREDKSIEAAIGMMRRDLRIDAPHSRAAFTISFTYPDRFKAQATISALVTKFVDSEVVITEADLMAYHPPIRRSVDNCIGKSGDAYVDCITANLGNLFPAAEELRRRKAAESLDLLDPASLPETPVAPNRWILAGAGLFVGLFLGGYTLRNEPPRSVIVAAR